MPEPVDLKNLRSMTDGDADMEKVLFDEFFSCFDNAIVNMQDCCREDKAENWRRDAHALKGISMNLGAMHLGELCKKAQDGYTAGLDSKNEMLQNIKDEYAVVRDFIINQCS